MIWDGGVGHEVASQLLLRIEALYSRLKLIAPNDADVQRSVMKQIEKRLIDCGLKKGSVYYWKDRFKVLGITRSESRKFRKVIKRDDLLRFFDIRWDPSKRG